MDEDESLEIVVKSSIKGSVPVDFEKIKICHLFLVVKYNVIYEQKVYPSHMTENGDYVIYKSHHPSPLFTYRLRLRVSITSPVDGHTQGHGRVNNVLIFTPRTGARWGVTELSDGIRVYYETDDNAKISYKDLFSMMTREWGIPIELAVRRIKKLFILVPTFPR